MSFEGAVQNVNVHVDCVERRTSFFGTKLPVDELFA